MEVLKLLFKDYEFLVPDRGKGSKPFIDGGNPGLCLDLLLLDHGIHLEKRPAGVLRRETDFVHVHGIDKCMYFFGMFLVKDHQGCEGIGIHCCRTHLELVIGYNPEFLPYEIEDLAMLFLDKEDGDFESFQ